MKSIRTKTKVRYVSTYSILTLIAGQNKLMENWKDKEKSKNTSKEVMMQKLSDFIVKSLMLALAILIKNIIKEKGKNITTHSILTAGGMSLSDLEQDSDGDSGLEL